MVSMTYWHLLQPSTRLEIISALYNAYSALLKSHWDQAEIFVNRARYLCSKVGLHACHIHSELDFIESCIQKRSITFPTFTGVYIKNSRED